MNIFSDVSAEGGFCTKRGGGENFWKSWKYKNPAAGENFENHFFFRTLPLLREKVETEIVKHFPVEISILKFDFFMELNIWVRFTL